MIFSEKKSNLATCFSLKVQGKNYIIELILKEIKKKKKRRRSFQVRRGLGPLQAEEIGSLSWQNTFSQ